MAGIVKGASGKQSAMNCYYGAGENIVVKKNAVITPKSNRGTVANYGPETLAFDEQRGIKNDVYVLTGIAVHNYVKGKPGLQ